MTMAASVVAYIFGEAKVDAARQFYQEKQPEKEESGDAKKEE